MLGDFFASDAARLDGGMLGVPIPALAAEKPRELGEPGDFADGAIAGGLDPDNIDFTRRIPPGPEPDGESVQIRSTPDGAFFVFVSRANFGFGAGIAQVYRAAVDDRDGFAIVLMSRFVGGAPANLDCLNPSISNDGLVVSFDTHAALDPARDFNTTVDVYVRDLRGGAAVTRLISRNTAGIAGNFLSSNSSVSGDGTTIVFTSLASDLLFPPPCNPCSNNVYRFGSDASSPPMSLVSRDGAGSPCDAVGCATFAGGIGGGQTVSDDGRFVVFQGQPTNFNLTGFAGPFTVTQVFLRDAQNGQTFLVSARTNQRGDGASRRPTISGDASHIAYSSVATNLLAASDAAIEDVFCVETSAVIGAGAQAFKISVNSVGASGNLASYQPALTPDGLHVAFTSQSTNLSEEFDTFATEEIFVRHLDVARTIRMSRLCDGTESDDAPSRDPDVFLDGRAVVYTSSASTLLDGNPDGLGNPPDGNNLQDVFESRLQAEFIRGDVDQNGTLLLNDAVLINEFLFLGGSRPVCIDGADVDDNDRVELTDAVRLLNFLFNQGPPPLSPYPGTGFDPSPDCLSCKSPAPTASFSHDH